MDYLRRSLHLGYVHEVKFELGGGRCWALAQTTAPGNSHVHSLGVGLLYAVGEQERAWARCRPSSFVSLE